MRRAAAAGSTGITGDGVVVVEESELSLVEALEGRRVESELSLVEESERDSLESLAIVRARALPAMDLP